MEDVVFLIGQLVILGVIIAQIWWNVRIGKIIDESTAIAINAAINSQDVLHDIEILEERVDQILQTCATKPATRKPAVKKEGK